MLILYNLELLAPRQAPRLEDHPFLAVRDILSNVYSQLPFISGGHLLHNLRMHHAMVNVVFYFILCE
jgi:hypothetical protein